MSKGPSFSVVVPMYSVEQYLPKCVDSLRRQTLRDIEIILVDDGSPDRCGEMAEEYAREDSRIKVVHRVNGGLGPARNSGMEVASGEYIGFVDSDDWVESDMYERLYSAAKKENADIVFTGMKTVSNGNVGTLSDHPFAGRTLHGSEQIFKLRAAFYGALPSKITGESMPVSVCIGGYRKSLLRAKGLHFDNVRSEDKFFNTFACRAAETIACIPGQPYCYRKDDQSSITKSFNPGTIDSFFEMFQKLELLAQGEPGQLKDECLLRSRRCVIDYCRVLIGMIESSRENQQNKKAYVKDVLNRPDLVNACKGYPWQKLPVQQALFFLALKYKFASCVRILIKIKRRR